MVHIVEKRNMRIAFSEDGRVLMQIPPEYRIIKMPDIEQVYSYTIKKEYANKDPKTQKIYLKITPDSLKLMTLVNNIPEGQQIEFDENSKVLHSWIYKATVAEQEKISLRKGHYLAISMCYKYPDNKKITIVHNNEEWRFQYHSNQLEQTATYLKDKEEYSINIDEKSVNQLYRPFNYQFIPFYYPKEENPF